MGGRGAPRPGWELRAQDGQEASARVGEFNERILQLYGRGMSTREIQDFFLEAYGAEVSSSPVSRVTDAVLEDIEDWRSRKLDPMYPIVYLDGLVRTDGLVQNRTVYIALGVNMDGKKEVLGLWMSGSEGAKFWLHVITELKNRGLDDILIACCDGLKGFPEAIEAVFPQTVVQTCIVHMVRNSMRFVSWGNRKAVAGVEEPGGLRGGLGRSVPFHHQVLERKLALRQPLLRLRQAHPQGNLHHQRNRGLEPAEWRRIKRSLRMPLNLSFRAAPAPCRRPKFSSLLKRPLST